MSEQSTVKALFDFIDSSPSCFHAVENLSGLLQKEGFLELSEGEKWQVQGGKNYFVKRNGSSIIAFAVPRADFHGFSIVASHSDSPAFKVKENGELKVEGSYSKLNTECYGGMIMPSWLDRPLSLAGRVLCRKDGEIQSRLINFNRDMLIIPNLAIHMQRDINDGHKYNPQADMLPLFGDEQADLKAEIAKELQILPEDILSTDLFLYPRVKGTVLGAKGEFIACPRLDDLQCAFSSMSAFVQSENGECVRVAAVFDNEEVGSGTKQGAASTFLFDTLTRLCDALGKSPEEYRVAIYNSFMLSADNAHAVHPNFPEKSDATCRNNLNKGPVIKFNANQKYTTDGVSASVFKSICERAGVPYQIFHNRSDMPGGSTLGNISNGRVSLNTVDIGIPQLAMHSAVETAGVKDTDYMIQAMQAFYSAVIRYKGDTIEID